MIKILIRGLCQALVAAVYVFVVANIMSGGEKLFDSIPPIFGPFVILLLFVISAAVMGILIFGKPVLIYLEKGKKEATSLLLATIGWLVVIMILTFVILIYMHRTVLVSKIVNNEPTGAATVEMLSGSENFRNLNIAPNQKISSPLKIIGEAKGDWFFEANFPVFVVNWDGLIIAQGVAQAKSDWMTENFVPFEAELKFTKPEYKNNGAIIFKKDNPSGLPANDAAYEMPILFEDVVL